MAEIIIHTLTVTIVRLVTQNCSPAFIIKHFKIIATVDYRSYLPYWW